MSEEGCWWYVVMCEGARRLDQDDTAPVARQERSKSPS